MINLVFFTVGIAVAGAGIRIAVVSHDKAKHVLALALGSTALAFSIYQLDKVFEWAGRF